MNLFFEKSIVSTDGKYLNNFRWNKNVVFQKHKRVFEKKSENFERKK